MNRFFSPFKNHQGMSLAQVMVAMGLTGVLSVILMNLAKQQTTQQKVALVAGEMTEIYASYVRVINTKSTCDATFAGLPKGADITELRYKFDDNEDPFAVTGQPFRGTKLILERMHLQTDAEYLATHNNNPQPDGIVVLEVFLTKPASIGGASHRKMFDVPVKMGNGTLVSAANPSLLSADCLATTGGDGCIADFATNVCCSPESSCMEGGGGGNYYGMCIDPTPPASADNVILGCTSL